jgi:hypothetical protein
VANKNAVPVVAESTSSVTVAEPVIDDAEEDSTITDGAAALP